MLLKESSINLLSSFEGTKFSLSLTKFNKATMYLTLNNQDKGKQNFFSVPKSNLTSTQTARYESL